MRINIFFLALLLVMVSCRADRGKLTDNQQFSKIEVTEFKKKNVSISSVLRFYNTEEYSLNVNYIEFDITVNGKDVGTFIKKETHTVPSKSIFEVPFSVDFKPEDAFLNLDYGIVKIKSDIVSTVEIDGYMLSNHNGKEEQIKISTNQGVLFTNDKDIYLDEEGNIQDK